MTLFYPANNLAIMDYNRVLKNLNGMSSKEFIDKLRVHFDISEIPKGQDTKPGALHKFSLYIDHKWYLMVLKESSLNKSTPITQLDSQILTDLVFEPLLGIMDLKKDARIDFVGGIRGHKELERRCNLDCIAAIALHPCSLTELMNVADANMIMPPKSTWFEPKPRAGFIVRVFDDDSVTQIGGVDAEV